MPALLLLVDLLLRAPAYWSIGRPDLAAVVLVVVAAGMACAVLGLHSRSGRFGVLAAGVWAAFFVASALHGFHSASTVGDLVGWISLAGLVAMVAAAFRWRAR